MPPYRTIAILALLTWCALLSACNRNTTSHTVAVGAVMERHLRLADIAATRRFLSGLAQTIIDYSRSSQVADFVEKMGFVPSQK